MRYSNYIWGSLFTMAGAAGAAHLATKYYPNPGWDLVIALISLALVGLGTHLIFTEGKR
jgi:hypothetical protein